MNYKAAMFDFDGTVTADGVYRPTHEMVSALVDLAHKMPVAFCTGRQLESFEKRAMVAIVEEVSPEERVKFFENFYLIAENGSIGYDYNQDKLEFEEFYREKWPDELMDRDEIMKKLHEAVGEYGEVCYDAHRVVVVMRTHMTELAQDARDIGKINRLSSEIYRVVLDFLEDLNPNYRDFVHVGDSGIGVVIVPAGGDKDNGIRQFGRFLSENKGIEFDDSFSEIFVVGDRPDEKGNDHYFLKGKYGTPFTVGTLLEGSELPKPVLDNDGQRLMHDKGTIHLIRSIIS
jgi:hydroxymethylpyrimidine pyrophosphatase-like HAD family hydrolase